MPSQPVPLRNWSGGYNNVSSIYSIDDTQLAMVLNMELDVDGSLAGRPAIVKIVATGTPSGILEPLGFYVREDGVTFVVVAGNSDTFLFSPEGGTWLTIWTHRASGFVQYDNKVVLSSDQQAGGYWEDGIFTGTPTMPVASDIVFYQERFWAYGVKGTPFATTVWFSDLNVISPAQSIWNWKPNSNFFTVSQGDGQWITCLLADTNALYVFRNMSSWKFTFPGSPSDGTLRQINVSIGADNKHCVASYDNWFLVLNAGFLYQFQNDRYYPLNQKKVRFERAAFTGTLQHDVRLSLFGRRAIVSFFGALYVYNIVTSTWSMWESPTTMASQFFMLPPSSTVGDSREAIVTTADANPAKQGLWRIQDEPLQAGQPAEDIKGMIRTKAYDFGDAGSWKRMTYWEAEAQTALGVEGTANPTQTPTEGVTWDDMDASDWDTLDLGTWGNPLQIPSVYIDEVEFPRASPTVAVFRLTARLKFTRCYFELFAEFDGTTRTSPTRIISITPQLMESDRVSKKVT